LERIAAPPNYERLIPALQAALTEWADADGMQGNIQVVVNPPMANLPAVLGGWARERCWWKIEPPSYAQILEGGQDWLDTFKYDEEKPLLIPDLGRIYLRHHNGLDLIRRLLDWLWIRKGLCLIGCDSWAWSYLSQALQIDTQLPPPLTLAACDSDHLLAWFSQLAAGAERFGFAFRQANNGKYVLLPHNRDMVDISDYLKHLAAFARGNPGLAYAIWRGSLQYGANAEVDPKALESAGRDANRTVWVKNLGSLNLPDLPGASQDKLFVLHTLLLHAGLPIKELAEILPLSAPEIMRAVHILRNAGLILLEGERWVISPLGYPAVRQILSQEGYLMDAF
jgi:DNA-binding transcriptional ArsR family regulator